MNELFREFILRVCLFSLDFFEYLGREAADPGEGWQERGVRARKPLRGVRATISPV